MKFLTSRAPLSALLSLPLLGATAYAQAPVIVPTAPDETFALRSKWTAGEKLNYEMQLDGTVNIQASPNSPSPLAGVPLDVDMKMNGVATLNTLRVDETGTGTLALNIDNFQMLAETFGQKAAFTIRDGRSNFTLNGQRMGGNRNDNATPPINMEISEWGRILKAAPVKAAGAAEEKATPAQPGVVTFDFMQLAQSSFWSVFPALWPTTPVKNGDKWSAEISWPPPGIAAAATAAGAQNEAAAPVEPSQLGKFDFTMRGAEEIAGRRVVRVAVTGAVELDEKRADEFQKTLGGAAQAAQAAPAPAAAANPRAARQRAFRSQLKRASQKVNGNLWFDVALGQVVRAELELETQTASQDVPVPGVQAPPRAKAGESWMDFVGNLQLQLKPAAPKA